jgi:hypothetical protein
MTVYYTTAAALRTELGVNSTVLPDATAERYIEEAEDAIDALIGGRIPDATTGRKILQGDFEAWQWTKLARAATLFSASLYNEPDLLSGPQWKSVSGPDFSFSGPLTGRIPSRVTDLLNDSGLRRTTGQAHVAAQTAATNREYDLWEEQD